MKNYKKHIAIALSIFALSIFASESNAQSVLKADKRIKTFVFNENEVYTVVAKNGFQTALEFSKDEKIDTISLGDPVGWRLTSSGRRIFIKPTHRKGRTNLSVFTNKRSYQFELVASGVNDRVNHSYIVRFFYPDNKRVQAESTDRTRNSLRPVSNTAIPSFPTSAPIRQPFAAPVRAPITAPVQAQAQLRPIATAPQAAQPIARATQAPSGNFNFNYTLSGPESIAPKKIFDDGKNTYFEYPQAPSGLSFATPGAKGKEVPINATRKDGPSGTIFSISGITSKFFVRRGTENVTVYNEQIRSLPSTDLVTSRQGARN